MPQFEDLDITGAHVQSVALWIQGSSVGPRARGVMPLTGKMLCFFIVFSSSVKLCDSVAAVCRRLCNSLAPWDDVRASIDGHLILLDNYISVKISDLLGLEKL